jgi:hypothetical protein
MIGLGEMVASGFEELPQVVVSRDSHQTAIEATCSPFSQRQGRVLPDATNGSHAEAARHHIPTGRRAA